MPETTPRTIFDYQSYKQCVNDWVRTQPSEGHGQFRRMAEYLSVHSVIMSQVFRGDRDLTPEQAIGIASFIGLGETERDYFLLLVQHARAGSVDLKNVLEKQMVAAKRHASALKNRVKHEALDEVAKATFYSHWYYSAIRLGVSIPEMSSVNAITSELELDRELVANAIQFLLENGLIVQKNGRLNIGTPVTHVGHDSPFVSRHHTNWRVKGLQSLERVSESDLHYTGPMALSEAAAQSIRNELIKMIEYATKTASNSRSEILQCLNVDWFGVKKRKN
jgi:uncharacterized protein (TIGR02147 family)